MAARGSTKGPVRGDEPGAGIVRRLPDQPLVGALVAGAHERRASIELGLADGTVQSLTVHAVDAERGLLLIKGAVPGPRGQLVFVRSAARTLGTEGEVAR